jgi:GEVED domain
MCESAGLETIYKNLFNEVLSLILYCATLGAITNFKLVGTTTTLDKNSSCSSSSYANYVDSTSVTTVPDLSPGNAYLGSFTSTNPDVALSIWIDYISDGYYADTERVLHRLGGGNNTPRNFSIYIPSSVSVTGIKQMRIRTTYLGVNLPLITACDRYPQGEAEDYKVNIIAPQVLTPSISNTTNPTNTTCQIGAASNISPLTNNANDWIQLLDADGSLIAAVRANGNNLGVVSASKFLNPSAGNLRISNGIKLMDRSYTITVQNQPVTPVDVRLYFTAAEFNALANGTTACGAGDVNVLSDLKVSKNGDGCSSYPNGATQLINQNSSGAYLSNHYLELSVNSFSSFYLRGSETALALSPFNFTATKASNKVHINWQFNNQSDVMFYEVLKSNNGANFSVVSKIYPDKSNNYNVVDTLSS